MLKQNKHITPFFLPFMFIWVTLLLSGCDPYKPLEQKAIDVAYSMANTNKTGDNLTMVPGASYVSTHYDDSAYDGTIYHPFTNVEAAVLQQPKSNVIIVDMSYLGDITLMNASNLIIKGGYDYTFQDKTGFTTFKTLTLLNCNNITFMNFDIDALDTNSKIIISGSSSIVLSNFRFVNVSNFSVDMISSSDILLENSIIVNIGKEDQAIFNLKAIKGFSLKKNYISKYKNLISSIYSSSIVISSNQISYLPASSYSAIKFIASSFINIENNLFDVNFSYSSLFYFARSSDVFVKNNIFSDNEASSSLFNLQSTTATIKSNSFSPADVNTVVSVQQGSLIFISNNIQGTFETALSIKEIESKLINEVGYNHFGNLGTNFTETNGIVLSGISNSIDIHNNDFYNLGTGLKEIEGDSWNQYVRNNYFFLCPVLYDDIGYGNITNVSELNSSGGFICNLSQNNTAF